MLTQYVNGYQHIGIPTDDIKEAKASGYEFREGPAFLPYWEHGVEYVTILGPNHEVVEFIQKFKSEEEKEKAVSEIG